MQYQAAVSKASKVLSCIKRGMDSRDRDIILPPVQIISKTSSGICSSVLGPSSQKGYRGTGESAEKGNQTDIGMEELSYEERLEELNLFTLEKRR